jgi:hypothetical protein
VRLRPLSEAECYARCYGGPSDGNVSVVRVRRHEARGSPSRGSQGNGSQGKGERLRKLFEERLDLRGAEDEAA